MAIKLKIPNRLTSKQEQWILTHVGPRMYYLHNKYGGIGWSVSKTMPNEIHDFYHWELTIEDEQLATFFMVKFL